MIDDIIDEELSSAFLVDLGKEVSGNSVGSKRFCSTIKVLYHIAACIEHRVLICHSYGTTILIDGSSLHSGRMELSVITAGQCDFHVDIMVNKVPCRLAGFGV